ncbi:hypothetical protein [Xenorhabdus griffiniae]|nr:hypothetical protein [Xenorhabdus griffiniae]
MPDGIGGGIRNGNLNLVLRIIQGDSDIISQYQFGIRVHRLYHVD